MWQLPLEHHLWVTKLLYFAQSRATISDHFNNSKSSTSYPGWHVPVNLQGGKVPKALPPVQRQHRAPLAAVIWSVIDILDELMHPTLVLQNNIELDCDGFEFLAKSPHISLRRLATAQWDDGFVPVFLEH